MSGAPHDAGAQLVAFLAERSVPCPRCAHDLCNAKSTACPECGEPLVLQVGSTRVRFGWLLCAMAPGCFSGVMAVFVLFPIAMALWHGGTVGGRVPWPIVAADVFGFLSGASVVLMYRHRHRFMAWPARWQRAFAGAVWGVHILALAAVVLAAILSNGP